jgi:hypothetical protein
VTRRRDQIPLTIIGWVSAAALALLSYDAAGAALDARRAGRSWVYPAGVSLLCLLLLAGLTYRNARRSFSRRE